MPIRNFFGGDNRNREGERQRNCEWAFAYERDRKSTRLNSSHSQISYAVFCLKKKTNIPCRLVPLHWLPLAQPPTRSISADLLPSTPSGSSFASRSHSESHT